jgi:hypothetical protein
MMTAAGGCSCCYGRSIDDGSYHTAAAIPSLAFAKMMISDSNEIASGRIKRKLVAVGYLIDQNILVFAGTSLNWVGIYGPQHPHRGGMAASR